MIHLAETGKEPAESMVLAIVVQQVERTRTRIVCRKRGLCQVHSKAVA